MGVRDFIVRVGYVDQMLRAMRNPLLELQMVNCCITANECLIIAGNEMVKQLVALDLSCNAISVLGLLHLCNPKTSEFEKLRRLTLYHCDIDQSQTYMVSNDRLENGKTRFRLTHLNLSENALSHFLNYVAELDLITHDLEHLALVKCDINDEQIVSLLQSEKLGVNMDTIDLSENALEKTYTLLLKYVRENCPRLTNLFLGDNPGLKNPVNNFSIAKPKKGSAQYVRRVDLSGSLRGDQAALQLAQGASYLRDCRYLDLSNCRIG
jgi:hypothetical protein